MTQKLSFFVRDEEVLTVALEDYPDEETAKDAVIGCREDYAEAVMNELERIGLPFNPQIIFFCEHKEWQGKTAIFEVWLEGPGLDDIRRAWENLAEKPEGITLAS